MHIRPIVQAPKHTHSPSLAIAAGGLIAFAVLASGLWHPKYDRGGITEVGRTASVSFEDGSVLTLSEPESDLDILRRRRMAGWGGHNYDQIFIMADGTEMEVVNNRPAAGDDDLDSGNDLMLTGYHKSRGKARAPLDAKDGVVVADLHVDNKDRVPEQVTDGKDKVVTDVIDNKDAVYVDGKDGKEVLEQPVFALTTTSGSGDNTDIIGALMGDPGSMWGNIRTAANTGLLSGGLGGGSTGGGGSVTTPPIGTAVPEPSTWALVGVGGAVALAAGIRRKRRTAVVA